MNRPATPNLDPFELVIERHGPAVLRFCVARLGADRGEEAFQETLLAALRHYDQLQNSEAVGGWLFAIAHRKIVDIARSHARSPMASAEIEEHAGAAHDPALDAAEGVWALVADLPAKQREAIALRYLADLSHADIAAAMATTAEAARRNLFEGLKRLRKDLAHD
jgi:RNA polymerase sigma factor (sigma-70 family)